MMNDNQQEIYDIIMNDEGAYNLYAEKKMKEAIESAVILSIVYDNPIKLTNKEQKELIKHLIKEQEEEL